LQQNTIEARLHSLASPETASFLQRFFKTGPGEYGQGDQFLGIRVPTLKKLTTEFQAVDLDHTIKLLHSPFHEARLLALLILVRKYLRGDEPERQRIYRLYMKNTGSINNWDLVDSSAPYIVGHYLVERSRRPLRTMARSDDLWQRRISIIATFAFIKRGDFAETLFIAEILRNDREDLIHKAVGWMLREIGKRDLPVEETFLRKHYKKMPRTMLRYAIEKFPEPKRKKYLNGQI
jgi:3-methyladenine DNA glycosylase AlkD